MKRELKSNKTEKKGFNKKGRGNLNFRSINNYQIDKIPNDNLYKNDNLYSIDILNFPKIKKLLLNYFITIITKKIK